MVSASTIINITPFHQSATHPTPPPQTRRRRRTKHGLFRIDKMSSLSLNGPLRLGVREPAVVDKDPWKTTLQACFPESKGFLHEVEPYELPYELPNGQKGTRKITIRWVKFGDKTPLLVLEDNHPDLVISKDQHQLQGQLDAAFRENCRHLKHEMHTTALEQRQGMKGLIIVRGSIRAYCQRTNNGRPYEFVQVPDHQLKNRSAICNMLFDIKSLTLREASSSSSSASQRPSTQPSDRGNTTAARPSTHGGADPKAPTRGRGT